MIDRKQEEKEKECHVTVKNVEQEKKMYLLVTVIFLNFNMENKNEPLNVSEETGLI